MAQYKTVVSTLLMHWWFWSLVLTLIARFIGPIWGPSGADRTQVGPMLAPWTLLSGKPLIYLMKFGGYKMLPWWFLFPSWCSISLLKFRIETVYLMLLYVIAPRCLSSEGEVESLREKVTALQRKLDDTKAALHELGRENQTLQVGCFKY